MRAETKKKHNIGKRFAIVIGVAAVGVMALGAQTASSTTGDPVDSTPPDLQLSGPKKQNPQKPIGPEENACPPEGDGWRACMLTGPDELWRGVHHMGHGEADERQDGQARRDRLRLFGWEVPPGAGAAEREAARAGPPGARQRRERPGEGHRHGEGCGRERGDREAHDHTRQVRSDLRPELFGEVGTTRSPKGYRAEWKGRLGGPSRYRVRDVTAALKAAGLRE